MSTFDPEWQLSSKGATPTWEKFSDDAIYTSYELDEHVSHPVWGKPVHDDLTPEMLYVPAISEDNEMAVHRFEYDVLRELSSEIQLVVQHFIQLAETEIKIFEMIYDIFPFRP